MTNRSLKVGIAPFARQQGAVARCRSTFGTKSYMYVGRGPAPEGVGGGLQGKVI
jgi:hypothetical protein